jgi:hypothetical protein
MFQRLKCHWRLLSRKHDGMAGLLIFSSTRSSPARHEMLKVGNSEMRQTDDIDVEVTALIPPVKSGVRATGVFGQGRVWT